MACVYCGGMWDDDAKRTWHMPGCYILTGRMTLEMAKRARKAREELKPLPQADGDSGPEAA